MDLTEDQMFEKYAKHCGHCSRNTFLPYEFEFVCIACGYNVIKQNTKSLKFKKNENILSID